MQSKTKFGLPTLLTKKNLRRMRFSIFVAFIATLQISANGYSQNATVSVHLKNAGIIDVFNEIERQSEYKVFYKTASIDKQQIVNINREDITVDVLLNSVLDRNLLSYDVIDRVIVITPVFAMRQGITITGSITDETGVTIPGVNVRIKGTTTGVISDVNGSYSITVPDKEVVLVFSFVGYATQESVVGDQIRINIQLLEDTQQIEEVVVVGYGTTRKSDLTGAISTVTKEQIKERSSSNVLTSLAGQVAGVQIQQTQGAPGQAPTVKIRGISTITSGTTPLYVIDGIPIEDASSSRTASGSWDATWNNHSSENQNANPLSMINPSDIESIEILKDASSAAIYGSRGANGVVIITTKKGSEGKTTFDVSYEKGIQQVARKIEMMDTQEWIKFYMDARNNEYLRYYAGADPNIPMDQRPNAYQVPIEFLTNPQQFGTTDWQDVAFRTAYSDNAYVSMSGGNYKAKYMLSGNYLNQEGIVDRSYYQRFTVRSNVNYRITDQLNLTSNITFAKSKTRQFGSFGKSDVVSVALQSAPMYPEYMETGTLGPLDPNSKYNKFTGGIYDIPMWHPYALTRETDNLGQRLDLMSNTSLEYKFLDHFAISTSLGLRFENYRYNEYFNEGQNWGWSNWNNAVGHLVNNQNNNWLSETILRYSNTFGYHDVSAMAAYSAQEDTYMTSSQSHTGFPNDMVHTLNAGGTISSSTARDEKWRLLSYIARVNYGYKNKYLVQATMRRDGSSRFGSNNKWGYFPSASLAWRMSEEDFLKGVFFLSQLKLRLSYGVTGNNQIGNYGSWSTLVYRQYAWGSSVVRGLYPSTVSDPNLGWERTGQYNMGINVGLFNNRVYFEADYYRSLTTDLLLNVPTPILTGFSSQLTNIGEVENKGAEFLVMTKNTTGELKWETNFNISFNRNKVKKLGPDNAPIYITQWGINKTEVGQPIANFFGYKFDGVFNNQAEIDAYPHLANTRPGDVRIVNTNDDEIINSDDRVILGNTQPKFIYGMTNNFYYKNFDLSIMLQGSYGGKIMNSQFRYNGVFNGSRNGYKDAANYWKSEADPGDGKHPAPYKTYPGFTTTNSNSLWIEDASFLRIANIRLGYNFSSNVLQKLNLSSLRLYVSVDNVHVFTKYKNGYDPENSIYSSALRSGEDFGGMPVPRTFTFGVKFGLSR